MMKVFKFPTLRLLLLTTVMMGLLNLSPPEAQAAPTALTLGDIAIIHLNMDNPDSLTFVALVDITAGTVIRFTDSGWLSSNQFRGNEGGVQWTAPAGGVTAGTIITRAAPFDTGAWAVDNDPILGTTGFNMITPGDQVFAFQGDSTAPTFLYGINNSGAHEWQIVPKNDKESALPVSLINTYTAAALNHYDNVRLMCDGPLFGTKAELLAYISDYNNWTGDDKTDFGYDPDCQFFVQPPAPKIHISQAYGGGGNTGAELTHDFIELFNPGSATIDLSSWSIQYTAYDDLDGFDFLTTLTGTIAPGGYYLIQQAQGSGGSSPLPTPDDIGTIAMDTLNGQIALVSNTERITGLSDPDVVDFVGYGAALAFEGSAQAPSPGNAFAIFRINNGCTDTDQNFNDFITAEAAPRNSETAFHSCSGDSAPFVSGTQPANNSVGFPVDQNLSITFSEQVTPTNGWFDITCTSSGGHDAVVTDQNPTYILDPVTNFVIGESCTVTIDALQISDDDLNDPPDHMSASYTFSFETSACSTPYTPINQLQGTGSASPLEGTLQTTEGVVTAAFSELDGFFIQSLAADVDTDLRTSEGIFVFSGAYAVNPGEHVRITGNIVEYNGGTTQGDMASMTMFNFVTNFEPCAAGLSTTPTLLNLPIPESEDPTSYLERYEAMLVTIPQVLTAQQNDYLGTFGQITLGAGGRLYQPHNGTGADWTDNLQRMIILDDGSSEIFPAPVPYYTNDGDLRAGDTLSGLIGILDQGEINRDSVPVLAFPDVFYRIHPTVPPVFISGNPRSNIPALEGTLNIAFVDAGNYFTSLKLEPYPVGSPYTTATPPQGADTATEFDRQEDKLVVALSAISADIFVLDHIEAWDGAAAPEALADALNSAAGENIYSIITDPGTGTGASSQFSQITMLYKSGSVIPLGQALSLDTPPFDTNSYPIAQRFEIPGSGKTFWVVASLFKEKTCKGSETGGDAVQDEGIGCYNATRTAMANVLSAWINANLSPIDPDVILLGDLQAFGTEPPIQALVTAGMTNQIAAHVNEVDQYSVVMDGMAGYSDHALTSTSLSAAIDDVLFWHINADEPEILDYNQDGKGVDFFSDHAYRSGSHDPLVIRLDLAGSSGYWIALPLILR